METDIINILLIEDNPDDVYFLRLMLQKVAGVHFELHPVTNLAAGLARLAEGNIQVVLVDLSLPDSTGMETFNAVKARARDIPVIILSGTDDETIAVSAVHAGAEDYLVKGHVNSQLVARAILYAIERSQSKRAVLQAESKYRGIFENSVSGIFQTTPEGAYLDVNPALIRIYGYSSREELMASVSDIARFLYVNPNRRAEFIKIMHEQNFVQDFESQ